LELYLGPKKGSTINGWNARYSLPKFESAFVVVTPKLVVDREPNKAQVELGGGCWFRWL
jgi:hypothetical protein